MPGLDARFHPAARRPVAATSGLVRVLGAVPGSCPRAHRCREESLTYTLVGRESQRLTSPLAPCFLRSPRGVVGQARHPGVARADLGTGSTHPVLSANLVSQFGRDPPLALGQHRLIGVGASLQRELLNPLAEPGMGVTCVSGSEASLDGATEGLNIPGWKSLA